MMQGTLAKMRTALDQPVSYQLPVGDALLPLNEHLGKPLHLTFTGNIYCTHCGRKTNKSFSQGFCFPCMRKLAQCDTCIVKPELCHYAAGTCREPEWGLQHCFQPHIVYLANASGLKVGITRQTQVPTRWIDQGAIQALPIARVGDRLQSGLLEVEIAKHVADKTNWRTMLKGDQPELDLASHRDRLQAECAAAMTDLQTQHGLTAAAWLVDADMVTIQYPVITNPTKISSLNPEKQPEIGGTLMGIRGQYLMFDTGVINIRKYTGYEITTP